MTEPSDDIPRYLAGAPASIPAPPVDTAAQVLPFSDLRWEDFERLCVRLARSEGSPVHVQLFGTRGQAQSGIDVYSRLPDGTFATYQCKRVAALSPADLRSAVRRFLDGGWASSSSRFVLCLSAAAVRVGLATELESLSVELGRRGIDFDVWDAEQLSARLKEAPDVVMDFFGAAWHERFFAGRADAVGPPPLAPESDPGLRTARVCRVAMADWRALGVAPTAAPVRVTDGLSAFVPRSALGELLARLRDALNRPGPTVVVLKGKSAAGKTRLAFEAIRRTCPDAWLIAPASADDARRLFHPRSHAVTRADPRSAVVLWLDDIEMFTRPAGLGFTTAHIDQLRDEPRPVVVLCTAGGRGVDVAGNVMDDRTLADLMALGGQPTVVDRRLDEDELAAYRTIHSSVLPNSLRASGLGPYLVGAARVVEAWRSGVHPNAADAPSATVGEALCLLDGALSMIASGAGLDPVFDDDDLVRLWTLYRGPARGVHGRPSQEAFGAALEWCSIEVSVGQPLLSLDARQGKWRVADVLTQYVIDECLSFNEMIKSHLRSAELMSTEALREYVHERENGEPPTYGTDAMRAWLDTEHEAWVARRLGRPDIELQEYERSVGTGERSHFSRTKLALALLSTGERDRALNHLAIAANSDPIAVLLLSRGRDTERKTVGALLPSASLAFAERLADVLELATDHRLGDIVDWVVEHVAAEGGGSVLSAVGQSMAMGRVPDDRFDDLYAAALERAEPRRCGDLAEAMVEALDLRRAVPLLRRAVTGAPLRLFDLGEVLAVWRDTAAEATVCLEEVKRFGDPRALQTLAALSEMRLDRPDEARDIYERAAQAGHVWAYDRLADHLEKYGEADDENILRLRAEGAALRNAGRPYHRHTPLFLRVGNLVAA